MNIEKNVPIPALKTGVMETLRALEVGDSFVFTGRRTSVYSCAKDLGIKITARAAGPRVEDGFRFWRVA